jgi:hypothetical protein
LFRILDQVWNGFIFQNLKHALRTEGQIVFFSGWTVPCLKREIGHPATKPCFKNLKHNKPFIAYRLKPLVFSSSSFGRKSKLFLLSLVRQFFASLRMTIDSNNTSAPQDDKKE